MSSMKKRSLKLKYDIQLLGMYDYHGAAVSHSKYVKWMTENCKGSWNYYSPDAEAIPEQKKPDDWPIFYKMIFYFTHKRDYEKFKKEFI